MATDFEKRHLSDESWARLEGCFDSKTRNRKRKYSLRSIWTGIFYIVSSGAPWRSLPDSFPGWQVIYYYCRKFSLEGHTAEIHDKIVGVLRLQNGQEAEPATAIIDSQTVKNDAFVSESTGVDGGKKIKGRKFHLAVDLNGYLLAVVVHAANIHDSKGLLLLLEALKGQSSCLKTLLADRGYRGVAAQEAAASYGWDLQISNTITDADGVFKPEKDRWVVERTHAWIGRYRRLRTNYEHTTVMQTNMILLAMTHRMLGNLA